MTHKKRTGRDEGSGTVVPLDEPMSPIFYEFLFSRTKGYVKCKTRE